MKDKTRAEGGLRPRSLDEALAEIARLELALQSEHARLTGEINSREAERIKILIKILLSESCPCDEDEVCHCPQGRALAALGICGFLRHGSCTRPKGHKGRHDHWALIPRGEDEQGNAAKAAP